MTLKKLALFELHDVSIIEQERLYRPLVRHAFHALLNVSREIYPSDKGLNAPVGSSFLVRPPCIASEVWVTLSFPAQQVHW